MIFAGGVRQKRLELPSDGFHVLLVGPHAHSHSPIALSEMLRQNGLRVTHTHCAKRGYEHALTLLPLLIVEDVDSRTAPLSLCLRIRGRASTAHIPILLCGEFASLNADFCKSDLATEWIDATADIHQVIGHIWRCLLRIQDSLIHQLYRLRDGAQAPFLSAQSESAINVVQEALRFMEFHLNHTLSATTIAQAVHSQASTLEQAFAQAGLRPVALVLHQMRMESAQHMLRHSPMDVWGIAQVVGYTCVHSFASAVQAHTGRTLEQLRSPG